MFSQITPSGSEPAGLLPAQLGLIRVTGAYARLLLDWLDQQCLHAPDLRGEVAALEPDAVVPIPHWHALLDRAAALRPDARPGETGLAIGALIRPAHVGLLGYLALASATLEEALGAYLRFEQLFYGINLAQSCVTPQHVEIRWSKHHVPPHGQVFDDVAIASLVTFMRRLWPQPPSLLQVSFITPRPADASAYEQFFGCPVRFGDDHVRVRFPASYRHLPLPQADPALRELLDRQAAALAAALPRADAFELRLQQALLKLLPDGAPTLESAAASLLTSARTLQRRLAERGGSFQRVLDDTREQLARRYLADPSLSVMDVTLLLGYSGQGVFTRAFKEWTGETPAAFRRRIGNPRRRG